MESIVPAISGPKRPQDYVALDQAKSAFHQEMKETFDRPIGKKVAVEGETYEMESGKVVIASITSSSVAGVVRGSGVPTRARSAQYCVV